MQPPFSSKPKVAFLSIIVLETSTLPTLVLKTLAFLFFARFDPYVAWRQWKAMP